MGGGGGGGGSGLVTHFQMMCSEARASLSRTFLFAKIVARDND